MPNGTFAALSTRRIGSIVLTDVVGVDKGTAEPAGTITFATLPCCARGVRANIVVALTTTTTIDARRTGSMPRVYASLASQNPPPRRTAVVSTENARNFE